MAATWTTYADRAEWLANRNGIGASESGAVVGYGFKSAIQLWREKRGEAAAPDLSGDQRVAFGNAVEEPMRALFRVLHPEFELSFVPYTVLRRDDHHSFLFCTPDGWLTEKETGRAGLWECKSATCLSARDWEKWGEKIPMAYYCQILHGMYVGDFAFAVLFAILRKPDGDAEIRAYHLERCDVQDDMDWLVAQETEFWEKNILGGVMPGARLRLPMI